MEHEHTHNSGSAKPKVHVYLNALYMCPFIKYCTDVHPEMLEAVQTTSAYDLFCIFLNFHSLPLQDLDFSEFMILCVLQLDANTDVCMCMRNV